MAASNSIPPFNTDHYAMTFDSSKKLLTIFVDLSEAGDNLPVMSSTGKTVIVATSHSFQPVDPTFKASLTVTRKPTPVDRTKLAAAALGALPSTNVVTP